MNYNILVGLFLVCEKFRLLQDCDSSLDWSDSANVSMVSDVCSALSYFKVCLTE